MCPGAGTNPSTTLQPLPSLSSASCRRPPPSQPLSLGSPGWGGNGSWAGPGPSCSVRTVWAKQHTSQTGFGISITIRKGGFLPCLAPSRASHFGGWLFFRLGARQPVLCVVVPRGTHETLLPGRGEGGRNKR